MKDTQDELEALMGSLQAQGKAQPANSPAPAQDHISPTLHGLQATRRPNPEPVCARCPNSLWHASNSSLACFCRAMHAVTWSSDDPQPIEACDGVLSE